MGRPIPKPRPLGPPIYGLTFGSYPISRFHGEPMTMSLDGWTGKHWAIDWSWKGYSATDFANGELYPDPESAERKWRAPAIDNRRAQITIRRTTKEEEKYLETGPKLWAMCWNCGAPDEPTDAGNHDPCQDIYAKITEVDGSPEIRSRYRLPARVSRLRRFIGWAMLAATAVAWMVRILTP